MNKQVEKINYLANLAVTYFKRSIAQLANPVATECVLLLERSKITVTYHCIPLLNQMNSPFNGIVHNVM